MYSIGIIGGADGPTAIMVSGDPTGLVIVGAVAAAAIIAAVIFVVKKVKNKK